MIALQFLDAAGLDNLPELAGTVLDGATFTQNGLIKNVGDEPLNGLKLWTENDQNPARPLTCTVVVSGVTLPDIQGIPQGIYPDDAPDVLQAPLAPGDSLPISFTWSGPSGVAVSTDTCKLRGGMR